MSYLSQPPRPLTRRPPVESMTGAVRMPLHSVIRMVALASAVTLVLGSQAILDWALALPVHPASDLAVNAADQWHAWMGQVGLTRPAEAARSGFRQLQN
ncbi:hypothetical protein [Magnetospirillum moscoviense]|uniref:Uncharacterized protein n=1 Tax=Magnetospirillum moscoviense TaxID=1437059 RepID=A0A178MXR6_9PROT|nr:hypothetical protein [Magnetospirillum moscoviense]MBF0325444.1 hypothetical protein [Alphaproteobacteria bacterium]OAN55725.1 hypothetical protein A6A05_08200 [Magnetospirillum moscoviense]